jgi:hypothetical protein
MQLGSPLIELDSPVACGYIPQEASASGLRVTWSDA